MIYDLKSSESKNKFTHLLQLNKLLSLLLSPAQFVNHLQCWVEVKTTEAVTKIEHIHPGLALEVVDVEGKFGTCFSNNSKD